MRCNEELSGFTNVQEAQIAIKTLSRCTAYVNGGLPLDREQIEEYRHLSRACRRFLAACDEAFA